MGDAATRTTPHRHHFYDRSPLRHPCLACRLLNDERAARLPFETFVTISHARGFYDADKPQTPGICRLASSHPDWRTNPTIQGLATRSVDPAHSCPGAGRGMQPLKLTS